MHALIGHEGTVAALQRIAEEERPAHAYLFSGRQGIGKRLVAIKFACLLNCPDPVDDSDHTCPVCRRICEGKHPDVIIESPVKGRIRIEAIRNLQGWLKYAPVEARYRICLINDAHLMNHQAQNALLKTLEEPPPARLMLLVSAKPARLLPTVRSRCRQVRFRPIPNHEMADYLVEREGLEMDKALAVASMSGGSIGMADEIERWDRTGLREKVFSIFEDPGRNGISGLLSLSAGICKDRQTASAALEIASTYARDMSIVNLGLEFSHVINTDLLDRITNTAQHHSCEALTLVYDELAGASQMMEADINVNASLLVDLTLLRITRILAGPSLGLLRADGTEETNNERR
ncbi:DNA polymerase III subunit delta' [Thermodesulfobacteriota bacterium]